MPSLLAVYMIFPCSVPGITPPPWRVTGIITKLFLYNSIIIAEFLFLAAGFGCLLDDTALGFNYEFLGKILLFYLGWSADFVDNIFLNNFI